MRKDERKNNKNGRVDRDNFPKDSQVPSKEAVEVAMEYVADRFGRALTRLSDR